MAGASNDTCPDYPACSQGLTAECLQDVMNDGIGSEMGKGWKVKVEEVTQTSKPGGQVLFNTRMLFTRHGKGVGTVNMTIVVAAKTQKKGKGLDITGGAMADVRLEPVKGANKDDVETLTKTMGQ